MNLEEEQRLEAAGKSTGQTMYPYILANHLRTKANFAHFR